MSAFEVIEAQLALDTGGFSEGVGEAVDSVGGLGEAMEGLDMKTAALGGALTALAAGGLAASVQAASNFQDEMVELEKVTNPETAAAMNDEIKNMAETIPLAQAELAQIASDAGRFGVRGTENIQSFTTAVSKMSVATDLSATEAGESLAKLAELTNTPISEVENLGSSINELSNNMATSSSEIVDSMLRSSSAMSQFGFSQTEIAGFSGALNAVSESSERAGSRLRRLMQEMSNPKKINNLAGAIGMTVEEFNRMQQNDPAGLVRMMAEAMAEGGTEADNLNKALSTTSRQALSGLGQNLEGLDKALKMSASSFDENTSLQKEFDAASKTLSNQVQLLRNRLTNVGISIGNVLLPPLTQAVKVVSGAVSAFSDFNSALGGLPGAFALIGTLVTGLAMVFGSLSAVLSTSAVAGAALSGAIGALGTAFAVLTGPVGVALAAVTAFAAAYRSDFAGIRTQTQRVVSALKGVFGPVISQVFGLAQTVLSDLKSAFSGMGGSAEMSIQRVVTAIGDWLVNAILTVGPIIQNWLNRLSQWWSQHGDQVVSAVRTMVNIVRTSFRIMANGIRVTVMAIRAVLGPLFTWMTKMWNQHGAKIAAQARTTWNQIRAEIARFVEWARPYVNTFVTVLGDIFKWGLNAISRFWSVWGEDIISYFQMVATSIRLFAEQFIDTISTIISAGLAILRGDWSTAWDLIEGYIRRTGGRIRDYISGWIDLILGYFQTFVTNGIAWFQKLYQRLIGGSIIPEMLSDIESAFATFFNTVIGSIADFAGDVVGDFRGLAEDAVGALLDKVGDFRSAGQALVTAVGDGIARNVSRVKGKVEGAAQTIRDYWPSSPAKEGPLSDIDKIGPSLIEEIAGRIEGGQSRLSDASSKAAESARPDPSSEFQPEDDSGAGSSLGNNASAEALGGDGNGSGDQVVFDFRGLDDDAMISIGDLEDIINDVIGDREHAIVKSASDGDFTL